MRNNKMKTLVGTSAAFALLFGAMLIPSGQAWAEVEAPLAIGQGTGGGSSALSENPQAVVEQMKAEILAEGPNFALNGEVTVLGNSGYSVNGEQFVVTKATRKPKTLRSGDYVQVRGKIDKAGNKIARVLTASEPISRRSLGSDASEDAFDGDVKLPSLSSSNPR